MLIDLAQRTLRRLGWLPTGGGLSEEEWSSRHRALLLVVAGTLGVAAAWGFVRGFSALHVLADLAPVTLAAAAAWRGVRVGRRGRSLLCTAAILGLCADGVHLSDGQPEAHFAFFIAIVLIALYEDWAVFGFGAAFVFAQHAAMGGMDASSTFGHGGSPVLWAAVHSGAVALCGAAALGWWRSNQAVRARAAVAQRRARQQAAVAGIGKLALSGAAVGELERAIVAGVQEVLQVPSAALLTLARDGSLHGAIVLGHERVGAIPGGARGSHSGLAVESGEPVVMADRERETRFDTTSLERLGLCAGISVPFSDGRAVRGTLTAHARRARAFDDDDVHFLDSMGHLLGGVLERTRMERELRHASEHDALTGLPNRATLMAHLDAALAAAERDGGVVAVLYADVDRFKDINDTHGHAAGDRLLQAIAGRLRSVLREGDVAARMGGDEFVLLAGPLADAAAAARVAQRARVAFAEPLALRGTAVAVGVSIGLAVGRTAGDAEALVHRADAEMYRVKRARADDAAA